MTRCAALTSCVADATSAASACPVQHLVSWWHPMTILSLLSPLSVALMFVNVMRSMRFVHVSRFGTARASAGQGFELDVITAVVIGGRSYALHRPKGPAA